jgi:DNA polymerase elongation subunit (family B)
MAVWMRKKQIKDDVKDRRFGYLIDGKYDSFNQCALLVFLDPTTNRTFVWRDKSGHKSYLYTDASPEIVKGLFGNNEDFIDAVEVDKYDVVLDKIQTVTKLTASNPYAIGGQIYSYRNQLQDEGFNVWEAWIHYHNSYVYDMNLEYSMPYYIYEDRIEKYISNSTQRRMKYVIDIMEDNDLPADNIIEHFIRLFETEIPKFEFCAVDIEVKSENGHVPNAKEARCEVITVSFADSRGRNIVYMLDRTDEVGLSSFSTVNAKVKMFKREYDLLVATFKMLGQYNMILTFNGDAFDFKYMYHRAVNLGIPKKLNPLYVSKYRDESNLRYGTHVDLYKFLSNRSIQNYAFKGAYKRYSLDAISKALINKEKIKFDESISELSMDRLAEYCLNDSVLLTELFTFDNNIIMNLIVTISRMANLTIEQVCRTQISTWTKSTFYYYHRMMNILIPNSDELKLKGEIQTGAVIKGKKYKGAIVHEPKPGIYFKVIVMDFACLDDKTEALTKDGWKLGVNLSNDDNILTFNKDKNIMEYQPVNNIFKYKYTGDLVAIDRRYLSFRGTPNHRTIFKNTRYNKGWEVERSDSLETYISIPASAPYTNGVSSFTDDEIRLFGWLISEGGFPKYGMQLYQSEGIYIGEIRKLLNRLNLRFTEKIRKRIDKKREYIWHILNPDFKEIKKVLYNGKRLTTELLNLPLSQSNILLETLMKGDGCISRKTYTTCDKILAEQVQELVIKLGKRGYIYSYEDEYFVGINDTDNIFLGLNTKYPNKESLYKREYYDGIVWCPNVDNEFFLARRDGKHFITGNSLYPSEVKENNICYSTINCPHESCKSNTVPYTTHHICTQKRGICSLIVGGLRDARIGFYKAEAKNKKNPLNVFYKVFEQAIKVYINAAYGVFGSDVFSLYCPPVAESITAYSRFHMSAITTKAEEMDIVVIGGDTDSIFLYNPTREQVEELKNWAKTEFNLDLGVDAVYRYGIWSTRKKNYLGVMEDGSLTIKGMSGKKSHIPIMIRNAFYEITDVLSNAMTIEEVEKGKELIKDISIKYVDMLNEGKYDINDLAFHVTLNRPLDDYTKTTPQHVRAGRMLDKAGYDVVAGQIISYVKIKKKSVEPIQLANINNIDINKYIKQLDSVLAQILEPLEIEFKYDILGIPKPSLLTDFLPQNIVEVPPNYY